MCFCSSVASGETCAGPSVTGAQAGSARGSGEGLYTRNTRATAVARSTNGSQRRRRSRLEAALPAFGEEDSPEKDIMKDFFARAVEQAKVKPVDVRIKSCESYLQRCTEQLEEAKASVKNCEEEVAKTQARLARLKMEADLQPPKPRVHQEEVESEVFRLRKQASELQ